MVRATVLGGVAGLFVVLVLMAVFAVSNGISEDLYAPLLVMGVPITVVGALGGVFAKAVHVGPVPRRVVRTGAPVLGLLVLVVALRLMGVI